MKIHSPTFVKAGIAGVAGTLALLLLVDTAAAKTTKTPASGKTAPATNAVPMASILEIPQSVFVIPATPKEGRNPFFPQSTAKTPPPPPDLKGGPRPVSLSGLVLNGITSLPKRTVMINNRTFETGESGEVKLPGGGKVLLKVEEIKADSAIIVVNGERRELRLRLGL